MPKALMQPKKQPLPRLNRRRDDKARDKPGKTVLRSGMSCGIHPYLRRLGRVRRIYIKNYASINLRNKRTFLTLYNSTISIKSRDTLERLTYSGVADIAFTLDYPCTWRAAVVGARSGAR